MIVQSFDAGEKIDKFAMVTMRLKGDFKVPIPQSVEYEIVNYQVIEPETLPKRF